MYLCIKGKKYDTVKQKGAIDNHGYFWASFLVLRPQLSNRCLNNDPKGCKLAPNSFRRKCFPWGTINGHKIHNKSWKIEMDFSIMTLPPNVKPLGVISSFAPKGMHEII
jgi:hypothetical protein